MILGFFLSIEYNHSIFYLTSCTGKGGGVAPLVTVCIINGLCCLKRFYLG